MGWQQCRVEGHPVFGAEQIARRAMTRTRQVTGGRFMTRHEATRAPLTSWVAETLRLTVFAPPTVVLDADQPSNWWRAVTGADPDTTWRKPRHGEQADAGPFAGGVLVLQVQSNPSRVD